MIAVEVAVVAPVRQCYTYLLENDRMADDGELPSAQIGKRVFVPFGASSNLGFIVGADTAGDEDRSGLRSVYELIDDAPLFHSDVVPLFLWLAEYYHYPPGQVISTALPGGLRSVPQSWICLADGVTAERLVADAPELGDTPWLRQLADGAALSVAVSRKVLGDQQGRRTFDRLRRKGLVSLTRSSGRDAVGRKDERCYRICSSLAKQLDGETEHVVLSQAIAHWFSENTGRSPGKAEQKTILLLQQLSCSCGDRVVPRRELTADYPYAGKIIDGLVDGGIVRLITRRVFRNPFGDLLPYYPPVEQLTPEQHLAVEQIAASIEARTYRTFLLHGVTGSGKTEVYLRAAEQALAHGTGVLVLVPEIALATQLEAHFVSRFGTEVALLHSGLSTGERYDEWSRVYSGTARVVVGARSAVFAPIPKLGLVIVDEEHDGSYKQQDGLRYHARDVAVVRSSMAGATVVLGSATPGITSFFNARQGKYSLLSMGARVAGRSLPVVQVVDMKAGRSAQSSVFHPELSAALEDNFSRGKQSILLINRRGFSSSMICGDCGALVECRHCKVTLNYHKKLQSLLCHYCGYRLPAQTSCGACGSSRLQPLGIGTERVGEELAALLPDARTVRFDSDTAADRKSFLELLQAVRQHEFDVLIGTQILAKGLHFPQVTLVGIVMADSGLGFPDFRAAERTYQLIAQVTGRAGRGDSPGSVIIQSMQPEHYAIRYASAHQYLQLAETELQIRRQAGFPPYSRLVFVLVEDQRAETARTVAFEVGRVAREWLATLSEPVTVSVLGPAPAAIERLRDRFRWQVMLKGVETNQLHRLVEHLAVTFGRTKQTRVSIDVDPDNML